jgi:hypothetical protein
MMHLAFTPMLFAARTLEASPRALADFIRESWRIILPVSFLVTFLVLWVVITRKSRRHHHRHGSQRPPEEPATLVRYRAEQFEDQGLLGFLKPKRRRRKRRFHHRNPTLAETGGLPPMRDGSPPTPCPPKQS